MPPNRPDSSLPRLEALEQWLNDLGMKNSDRIHQAIGAVREHYYWKFLPNPISDKEAEARLHIPWYARTLSSAELDVIEFLDIFDAFRSEPRDLVAPKIERASSGPFMPVDEKAENADGRNMQFELSLAAEWRLNGLDVTIGEPDFTLSVGATNFIIECKRPYSEGSIRSNIRKAKQQLEAHLDRQTSAFGAIAISINRIVVPPTHTLISPSLLPSVQRDPDRYLQAVLSESRQMGQSFEATGAMFSRMLGKSMDAVAKRIRWRNFDCHERVVGIFFHAAPFVMHASGFHGRAAVQMVGPIGNPGPAFSYLQSATDAAYNRGWPRPIQYMAVPSGKNDAQAKPQ